MGSLEFCIYSIVSSENIKSFTSSFPIWISFISLSLSLFFFFCLIAMARPFNTMLNKSNNSGFPVLFLILEEKFSAFHHQVYVNCVLSHMAFIMLQYIPSLLTLLSFYHNAC